MICTLNIDPILREFGFEMETDDGQCARYTSVWPHAIKHKISGYNQNLGNGQRIVSFNRKYNENKAEIPHLFLSVECDGGTRTLFNGVISHTEDLRTVLTLID